MFVVASMAIWQHFFASFSTGSNFGISFIPFRCSTSLAVGLHGLRMRYNPVNKLMISF